MRVEDFDYELPEELIAQSPLPNRADSRLLVCDPVARTMVHTHFWNIGAHLRAGDVLVFNNSKVLPARLFAVKEDTGGRVELLLVRPVDGTTWEVLARPAKRLRPGTRLRFLAAGEASADAEGAEAIDPAVARAEVLAELPEGMRTVRFEVAGSFASFLERAGTVPLPPYIRQPLADRDRYQTVYADPPGSVAAPTAGLHFTHELLASLREMGVEERFVTLHVGLGTFRPVQVERVEEHRMHSEWYDVPPETAAAIRKAKAEGRRVIAVGTTALRTLEAAGAGGTIVAGSGETDIFIYPGFRFQVVDALITNFHLPKSTLLMLVAAMMGLAFTKEVYREAVRERYRFFSFGDAMFITRRAEVDEEGRVRDPATGAF
ncbi:S-adenosylmethionine:tRNA ribosyltransferase-isomerase [Alicyclobacillus cellulosilyticus]|uniref:S-adenosylmethionine:tRNA ribosyltransferase-isomerase n=1 Tax=Alicyclobacillus cellulosilyticus TaxID=1003997 RepID=A0A917NJT3_9BACL|nr:tRNA preQ1(34) S-adenosylmethionine ribosyltransferase-isomerase QueA [Alicyclobacillus cellulosilyticus]GGJ06146.1 S-adenosylmethionine:tRNA ribosyltransferase-isomerase [Alicyclobacillus cellulosilyticus]